MQQKVGALPIEKNLKQILFKMIINTHAVDMCVSGCVGYV
jgi:predicted ATP-grasp superfamily ATP-dependent carboligase